jgi:hypothetical protein
MSHDERRRHPRYKVDLPMTLSLAAQPGGSFAAELQDLSAGGFFLRTALGRADFGNAALSFRRELRAPLIAGRVVRRVPSQGFAVSFDRPGVELERLVSALAALTPPLRGEFVASFLDAAIEAY